MGILGWVLGEIIVGNSSGMVWVELGDFTDGKWFWGNLREKGQNCLGLG
ncbi:hypothetical protein FWH09_00240 [Candidatus Saccharibacteria bacterium]|nr:hypothetical protein [Candidatus Saccharibacteria bacterium]